MESIGASASFESERTQVESEAKRVVNPSVKVRTRLIGEAIEFSKSSAYRRSVYSRHASKVWYRNLERDSIQAEANEALMRKDCFQANYNDYIPSAFEKHSTEREHLINIPLEDVDSFVSSYDKSAFPNIRVSLESSSSSLSISSFNLSRSLLRSNFTFNSNIFSINSNAQSIGRTSNATNINSNFTSIGSNNIIGQSSIGSSNVINQSSIGSTNVINQSSIGSSKIIGQTSIGSSNNLVIVNQSSIGSGNVVNQSSIGITNLVSNQTSIGSKTENVIVDLIKSGMSPGEVAKLSDVFQYPSCFRQVSGSIIPWLQRQLRSGYWNNNSSLFILCLIMALSAGSVETIFKLNSTWGGLVFLFAYLPSFLFIVQPMFCFELGLGQLFRCSPFEIFDKLVPGMGGVGVAMVILCLLSACIASSRTCSEFLIYFVNVFKKNMIWDLSVGDIDQCVSMGTNAVQCNKLSPLCFMVEGTCKANKLGKAYLAYQNLFDNIDVDPNLIDYNLVIGIVVTYLFVFILQMIGLTNFTFFAFVLVIVIFFLSHAQVYFSLLLDGSTTYVLDSITKMDYSLLYKNSRIWSHSVRCCIYEYLIGNGIYSTLASKSRIGYDLSLEAMGVGLFSGYITALQFISALALVGYFCVYLSKIPNEILWMLEQDSSFILLPMGFIATNNMERTLLVLQFCSCSILITFTLSIQIEVILSTICRFVKIKRTYITGALCVLLTLVCLPLCNRTGRRVIWFLEIAVGDLGRVFMVLMTCIVIGWFYNSNQQIEKVGRTCLYLFNTTFWLFNISVSIGELLDEKLPLYIWWIIRLAGILLAAMLSMIVYVILNKPGERIGLVKLLYILFIGNIEGYRSELNRISPMKKSRSICWSILWSISIKWVSCCLLSNSLADILEEIISTERVETNIHTIPNNYKIITLILWLLLIIIILFYPLIKVN